MKQGRAGPAPRVVCDATGHLLLLPQIYYPVPVSNGPLSSVSSLHLLLDHSMVHHNRITADR